MRRAGSGGTIAGFDWPDFMAAATASGIPGDWLVMLLPAIEAGMLAAIYPPEAGK